MNPQNVLEQAKRYAAGVYQPVGNWDGLRVPFLYATNGEIIWHLDMRRRRRVSRQTQRFPHPDALAACSATTANPPHDWLLDTPPEQIDRLRPYQRDCILAVESSHPGGSANCSWRWPPARARPS